MAVVGMKTKLIYKSIMIILATVFVCNLANAADGVLSLQANKKNPPLIFWLVLEQNNQIEFLDNEIYEEHINQLRSAAAAYEIPLLLPMLDLGERMMLTEQDVAAFKWDVLLSASQRYPAEVVVAGKLAFVDNAWRCQWQLYQDAQPIVWQSQGSDLQQQFVVAVETIAMHLLEHKVRTGAVLANNGIKIHVSGINNLNDYAQVMHYLQGVKGIKNVEVKSIVKNSAEFTVTTSSDQATIAQNISQNPMLIAEHAGIGQDQSSLNYRTNL